MTFETRVREIDHEPSSGRALGALWVGLAAVAVAVTALVIVGNGKTDVSSQLPDISGDATLVGEALDLAWNARDLDTWMSLLAEARQVEIGTDAYGPDQLDELRADRRRQLEIWDIPMNQRQETGCLYMKRPGRVACVRTEKSDWLNPLLPVQDVRLVIDFEDGVIVRYDAEFTFEHEPVRAVGDFMNWTRRNAPEDFERMWDESGSRQSGLIVLTDDSRRLHQALSTEYVAEVGAR